MDIKIAYSTKQSVHEAVTDLQEQFGSFAPNMILFFASSTFDPDQLSHHMHRAFSPAVTFGNTTAGEIVSGHMLKNSVVAMAFNSNIMNKFKVEVVKNIQEETNIPQAFSAFEKYFGVPMAGMNPRQYVGMILVDGMSGAEERLMDRIGDLTNIFFIGGSAGDDLRFEKTYVFANGKAYTNAAVLAVLKPEAEFDFIKTQSFCSLNKPLVATWVNEANREVIEFNDKPASQAYAEALGTSVDGASNYFMKNPVGLLAENEIFVRSPQQIQGDSIIFYCNVIEGMELTLLDSTDIIKDTRQAIEEKKRELGNISGIINFHCILRTLELEQEGLTDAYGQLFSDIPTIGFSTYGEEYLGHINQTSTMLAFK